MSALKVPSRRSASFSGRLAFAFASVAAFTAVLAAVLTSAAWNYQFNQYLRDNMEQYTRNVAAHAASAYAYYGGWNIATSSFLRMTLADPNVAVQVLDEADGIVYRYLPGESQSAQPGDTEVRDSIFEPSYRVASAPIIYQNQRVGTVRAWVLGREALIDDRDERFRRGSVVALGVTALIAIVLASIAGTLFSRQLVRPIERITATARALRQGDPAARSGITGEDEIATLGMTLDEMADAIEADRELERRLTADVAHELRTPLQSIQATVEAMQDGVFPADEERLGIVRDETVRLARLADGILELTRLERGSVDLVMERIDVSRPVVQAVDAAEALLESCELTLSVDVEEGVHVMGDIDRLQQAVGNLLSNAARYTAAGGRVAVRVGTESGQAVIEVSDTGAGIRPEDLRNVFSRFWRADSARAQATGGLGIGLAVTREIVERHKGMIGVDSVWGEGTRFTIRLPIAS